MICTCNIYSCLRFLNVKNEQGNVSCVFIHDLFLKLFLLFKVESLSVNLLLVCLRLVFLIFWDTKKQDEFRRQVMVRRDFNLLSKFAYPD